MTEIPADSRVDVRARIVDEVARLLQAQGPSAATTRRVAEAAGVQAPTIYRLFGDKDGLLEAVAEHVMATYLAAKAEVVRAATVDDIDPVQELRDGWRTQIDFGLANPTLFRLLSDPDRVVRSPAARSGLAVLAARVHRVALTGRMRVTEQRAVALIQAGGVGAIQTLLATPPEQRDAGLGEAMLDAVLGQILVDEAPGRHDDESVASTVAVRAVAPLLDGLTEAERALMREWLDRALHARQA